MAAGSRFLRCFHGATLRGGLNLCHPRGKLVYQTVRRNWLLRIASFLVMSDIPVTKAVAPIRRSARSFGYRSIGKAAAWAAMSLLSGSTTIPEVIFSRNEVMVPPGSMRRVVASQRNSQSVMAAMATQSFSSALRIASVETADRGMFSAKLARVCLTESRRLPVVGIRRGGLDVAQDLYGTGCLPWWRLSSSVRQVPALLLSVPSLQPRKQPVDYFRVARYTGVSAMEPKKSILFPSGCLQRSVFCRRRCSLAFTISLISAAGRISIGPSPYLKPGCCETSWMA